MIQPLPLLLLQPLQHVLQAIDGRVAQRLGQHLAVNPSLGFGATEGRFGSPADRQPAQRHGLALVLLHSLGGEATATAVVVAALIDWRWLRWL